jgi:uncharacterized protein YkwD
VFTSRSRLAALLLTIICAALAASSPASAERSVSPERATIARRHHHHHGGVRRVHGRRIKRAAKHRAGHPHRTPAPGPASTAPELSATLSASANAQQNDAATIASVLATPCQNTELTPSPENIELVRTAILCLINHKRAENSESPLTRNPELEQAAEGHCQELIADDYFAHVSPSGETPVDRIRDTGYIPSASDGYVIGENLAWGTYQLSTPQSIVAAWIASPGHLANILEAQYRETGIGVTPNVPASLAEGAPGATYAQEFGVIIH